MPFSPTKSTITTDRLVEVEKFEAIPADTNAELALKVDKVTGKELSENDFTDTLKTKLDGIEAGAEVNPDLTPYQLKSEKGVASGYASLDGDGTVPASQLPSYVDDVLEFDTLGDFPNPGETGKIYVAKDTNKTYRWSGSTYVEIVGSIGVWRGEYDNLTSYILDDRVSYLGSSYICTASTTGNLPTNIAFWDVLAEKGDKGDQGDAATLDAGTTTTTAPGTDATVTNSGTVNDAIFDFTIPRGEKGDKGDDGVVQSIVGGTNISVNSTDPAHPIVSSPNSMQNTIYDPSTIEKDLFATSQNIYVNGTTGDDTNGNGSVNAPYATIQHTIDSITDNSITKKYLINVAGGTYTEQITLKEYVNIDGGHGAIISGTAGPLVTLGGGRSFVLNVTLDFTPTVTGQSMVSCADATGNHIIFLSTLNINTTEDVAANAINTTAGAITVIESLVTYAQTGTSVTVTEHDVFKQSVTGSIRLLRTDIIGTFADENNNVNIIRDTSSGLFLTSQITIQGICTNASYTGKLNAIKGTGAANLKLSGYSSVILTGAGSGTGQIIELDSTSNDVAVDISYNIISVSGFTTNRGAEIASGDTINAYFNTVTIDELYTGAGTVNIVNTNTDGELIVNTEIKDLNTFISASTNQSLNDLFNIGFNAGWVSGGAITEPGTPDGTATVAAGTGLIRISNDEQASIKMFDWAEATGLTFTTGVENYVYVDYNGGTPIIGVTTNLSDIEDNENDKFELYGVFKEDATILHITDHKQRAKNVGSRLQQYLLAKNHIERTSGLLIGETGTRNVSITEGIIWTKLNPTTLGPIDTSGTDTFDRYYACDTTCVKQTGQTQWDNDQYDNAGTLTTLGASKYSFQDFYIDADNELLSVYATGEYTSNELAEAAAITTPPDRVGAHAIYVGRITFQKLGTVALSILSPFTGQTPGAVAITDHGSLSGLTDDDHIQYALLAGRSGGQIIYGSTDSGEDLILESTSNATKGKVKIGTAYIAPVDDNEVSPKKYVDDRINELDAAVILKGNWDASVGTFPASTQAGWSYIVSVAGTVDGIEFNINDRLISILDNASTTVYAGNWIKADYTDNVLSVHGRIGAVVSADGDYTQNEITGLKTTDSPSFAGLTIDTDTLFVDSTNDKVGIGTNSPSSLNANANNLVVGNGTTAAGMTIYTGTGSYASLAFADGVTGDEAYRGMVRYNHPLDQLEFFTAGTLSAVIDYNGVTTFSEFPVTPSSAPTTDYQVANKKYVDDSSGGASSTQTGAVLGAAKLLCIVSEIQTLL